MILKAGNQALVNAVTIHPKSIKSPLDVAILKPVADNGKMGKGGGVVKKGKWRGMPMFVMSLTERASCPSTCKQWASCYANNMMWAHRIDHTHPDFIEKLGDELASLSKKYRHGFVVRLHVIGDIYSPEYAAFWIEQTALHPNMHIFGFTHHERDSMIGRMVTEWNKNPRVWVRFSDQGGDMSANVEGEGFPCPEQTGQTESCLTCAACWSTVKAVSFKAH